MAAIESILALIVTISILVTIHEYGHYWVARRCGVKVLRFSIGFGKPLIRWRGKPVPPRPIPEGTLVRTRSNENLGTEFVIAAIPLGGYVKMLDEREGFVADDERHLSFNGKPPLHRMAIVCAGPVANFLLAIVAYWLLFVSGVSGLAPLLGVIDPNSEAGQAGFRPDQEILEVDGETTATWADVNLQLFRRVGDSGSLQFRVRDQDGGEQTISISIKDWLADAEEPFPSRQLGLELKMPEVPAVIGELIEGGRAEASGFLPGDRIDDVDGRVVGGWQHWVEIIRDNPEHELVVGLTRSGQDLSIRLTPAAREENGRQLGYIGAGAGVTEVPEEMQRIVRYGPLTAATHAIVKTWDMSVFTLQSIGKMIKGAISSSNLSGPITIARIAGASAKSGLESFIGFIALLSVSLGVLNLLPIPVLDGGHLLYYLIELVMGRPVPERVQALGTQLGICIIVGMMLLAFYNDLARF